MTWSDDHFDPDNMTRATQALRLARLSGDVICVKTCASELPFEVEGNHDGIGSSNENDAIGRGNGKQVREEERTEGVFPLACCAMAQNQ